MYSLIETKLIEHSKTVNFKNYSLLYSCSVVSALSEPSVLTELPAIDPILHYVGYTIGNISIFANRHVSYAHFTPSKYLQERVDINNVTIKLPQDIVFNTLKEKKGVSFAIALWILKYAFINLRNPNAHNNNKLFVHTNSIGTTPAHIMCIPDDVYKENQKNKPKVKNELLDPTTIITPEAYCKKMSEFQKEILRLIKSSNDLPSEYTILQPYHITYDFCQDNVMYIPLRPGVLVQNKQNKRNFTCYTVLHKPYTRVQMFSFHIHVDVNTNIELRAQQMYIQKLVSYSLYGSHTKVQPKNYYSYKETYNCRIKGLLENARGYFGRQSDTHNSAESYTPQYMFQTFKHQPRNN